MERDIILTVYACSSKAPCTHWAKEFFEDEPIVLAVPGSGGTAFRQKAIKWALTGDLFAAALKELRRDLKDVTIRKRALVTFSAGWAFADEILKVPEERKRLDAYLLLDGCHTKNLRHWAKFAALAAKPKKIMIMAHSSITPPFISSTNSNKQIFLEAKEENNVGQKKELNDIFLPQFIVNAEIPKEGITISLGSSGNLPAIKKSWKRDALINFEAHGNLIRLHYQGNDRPDHVYIAWYVSERLWKWLGELWNSKPSTIDKSLAPDDAENEIDIEIEYEDDDEDKNENKNALKLDENKSEITPYENKNIISRILGFIWSFLSWLKIKFKK